MQKLLAGLDEGDVIAIRANDFRTESVHFSLGRFLRNSWSLWDTNTVLVQHYRTVHSILHADDISGLILGDVSARVRGEVFDFAAQVAQYHAHWTAQGLGPMGIPS